MQRTVVTHDDGADVTVTGGKVYTEETEQVTEPEIVLRNVRQDEYKAMRADYLARIAAVETERTNWATMDAQQRMASVGTVIIPALLRTMRVTRWIVDHIFDIEGEAL